MLCFYKKKNNVATRITPNAHHTHYVGFANKHTPHVEVWTNNVLDWFIEDQTHYYLAPLWRAKTSLALNELT